MKAFISITIGQEINGRNVVVKVDKACKDKEKIEEFIKTNKTMWNEFLEVPGGKVNFLCERHIHEIEVEE
jgi:hypothetical protein